MTLLVSTLHWLIHTTPGPLARLAIGLAIFALLAGIDLRRHGAAATRWREYAVLLAAVALSMLYGIANDQITSRISWEYFYFGKELAPILSPATPPDAASLHWQAVRIGAEATWSAGLVLGVILLLANNPWRGLPRLRYRRLLGLFPVIAACTILCAIALGIAGYAGGLTWMSADFAPMLQTHLFRPRRFMCVYGIHLGGYIGGLLGTLLAAALVVRARRRSGSLSL